MQALGMVVVPEHAELDACLGQALDAVQVQACVAHRSIRAFFRAVVPRLVQIMLHRVHAALHESGLDGGAASGQRG